jgi:hypothetical protein
MAALVLLSALLTACSGIDYNLYGAWRNNELGLTMEFQQDGSLLYIREGIVQKLLFKFAGPGGITISVPGAPPGQPENKLPYQIQGDRMIMTLDEPVSFTRLK